MELTDLKLNSTTEVHVTDSLKAPLLGLKIKRLENTVAPEESRLIVYVDKSSKDTPTEERREYVFDLSENLKYSTQVSDEFLIRCDFNGSDLEMKSLVNRYIDTSNNILTTPTTEELNYSPIILFEGENYVYTNYQGANIELIYPKDDDLNRLYLSNAIYCLHKLNNSGEFSLNDIYFKDAFTKTEDKLNLVVDNVDISCITSKNNNFSLDEDGNLIVNTVTSNNDSINILDAYPVGSIYMSVNNENPSTIFGGTWEAWGAGKVPVGIDTTQTEFDTAEKTGGEKNHTLVADEMPLHTHTIASSGNHTHTYTGFIQCSVTSSATYTAIAHKRFDSDGTSTPASMNSSGAHTHTVASTGGSVAHNNLQPYITCYMWKRTA